MTSNYAQWLSKGLASLLVLVFLISSSVATAQPRTVKKIPKDPKFLCYEVMKEGAKRELNYDVPDNYESFQSKAKNTNSAHTSFATHLTEPLFRFQQYREGKQLFTGEDKERFSSVLQMDADSPSLRFQEFETNFLSSYDPEKDKEYLEYCGVRIVQSNDEKNPVFGMKQEEFGMMDPVIYQYLNDTKKDGKNFKVALKTRIIRDINMAPIGMWKAFDVFPESSDNDFFHLYEMSTYLKQLFDQRRNDLDLRAKNARFRIIQKGDPATGKPEIKEDVRTKLRMINGVLTSVDQFRGINMKFQQRLVLLGKEISKYLSMPIYEDQEQRDAWRDFQNGLTEKPDITPPEEVPALLYIQDVLDGTQEEMEMTIFGEGNECYTEEQKQNFQKAMQVLDEKYQVGDTKLERKPGINAWPTVNLKRESLSPEDFKTYTQERWAIEKEYRMGLKGCMDEMRKAYETEGCTLTDEENKKIEKLSQQHKKNIEMLHGGDMDTKIRNERIGKLTKKYRESLEEITSKCELFTKEQEGLAAEAEKLKKKLIKTALVILPIAFVLIFGVWYWLRRKKGGPTQTNDNDPEENGLEE